MEVYDKSHRGYFLYGEEGLNDLQQELRERGRIVEFSHTITLDEDEISVFISAPAKSDSFELLIRLDSPPGGMVQKFLLPKSRFMEMKGDEFEQYFNSKTIPFLEKAAELRIAAAEKAQTR